MQLITSPLRLTDLTHTRSAILEHAERIVAWSRLLAERMLPLPADLGLLIDQRRSPRKWHFSSSAPAQRSHLINLAELDEYGVHALLTDAVGQLPAGEYVALC